MKIFTYTYVILLVLGGTAVAQTQNKGDCRKQELHGIQVNSSTDLKKLVQKVINKVLKVIEYNDPFQVKHSDINYNSYGIESEGYVEDMFISYISSTKVTNLVVENTTSSITFGFDLKMKQFQVVSKYKLNFSVLTMLPIYGEGNLGILLDGIGISVKTTLKETENKILQMTDLTIGSSLNGSKVEIENLFNNVALGTYVSNILTDVLPSTVNENQNVFAAANIGLKALVNVAMCNNEVTLDKIIDVMQHFIE